MDPEFLSVDDVVAIHQDQVDRYGGSPALRDPGLLASAVEAPRATFGGQRLHEDLFEMAAAYLFHLVQNHPFVDGNKRTGAAAALIFLDLNGVELEFDDEALVELVLEVAQGRADKKRIAEAMRERGRPLS